MPLIARVWASPNKPSPWPLTGRRFPVDAQKDVCRTIVAALGYNKSRGRIDVSVYPFTMSLLGGHNVRITGRFSDDDWYQGLMGTVHEGGHTMYKQSLGDGDLSIDSALSMGVHESQSLFWERHVGKSRGFYKRARPILMEAFHEEEDFSHSAEELYAAVNAVDFDNPIRMDADELT